MKLKLGVIMDPISSIHIKKDSTFAMLLEAQRRGWPIFYLEQKNIFLTDGVVFGKMKLLQVFDDPKNWYQFGEEKIAELSSLNVILMRKDPPIDSEYLYITQLLERVEQAGTLIVNKPQSLRDFNEKLFITMFPNCCAPTMVTADDEIVKKFLQQHEDIVCKPLHAMGGQLVFRIRKGDPNLNVVIETLTNFSQKLMMAQKYIPEIIHGDKRIILIDGVPVPFALARFAKPGETRANLAAGGSGKSIALTKRDYWICEQIAPILQEKGLLFVGIDVIGDYLTEINITSPTCIRELDAQENLNISADFFNAVEKKLVP